MIIREIQLTDAENLANLMMDVDKQSEYMLWEAGERNINKDAQRQMIESIQAEENSTILVAEIEDRLVGYLLAIGGKARRNKHSAYIVIGIPEAFRGKGIGTKLFLNLDEWAQKHHVSRLELTVVTKNEAGISLYKKAGFEIEGTKRNSVWIQEEFVDEYYMSKLL
ncbi:GNAT family N-acetyltransferase [Salirhabdus sp. Marseille-P4669]|uniref:GNAT family N-acetyltransferase n=1 Tax=Salirhabdus sp. Marseille-P4669 TaxID=2042310 RepID=UPI000C7B7F87|nr:GNAT family N-acetyltransferase [Salirhabdus sp. Marseille-P4669]